MKHNAWSGYEKMTARRGTAPFEARHPMLDSGVPVVHRNDVLGTRNLELQEVEVDKNEGRAPGMEGKG